MLSKRKKIKSMEYVKRNPVASRNILGELRAICRTGTRGVEL